MLKAIAQSRVLRHSPVATVIGWIIAMSLAGLSLWIFAMGSPMSAIIIMPPVLLIEAWLFLRTPRPGIPGRK